MKKNITWYFLLFFAVAFELTASSQEKMSTVQIDSLRHELNKNKGYESTATQLELAFQIVTTNAAEAQDLAKLALAAAKKRKNKTQVMQAYYILGRANHVIRDRDIAEAYYDSALSITEELHDNWYKGEILFRKGLIKHINKDAIKAIEYLNSSLHACLLSNNFKIMGSAYSMLGTIFRINGLYDRAIEYTINSKLYYEKAGFSEGHAWAEYLLGRIYFDLKLNQKALDYFHEALDKYIGLAANDGNKDGIAICYEQIGMVNLELGNYTEALEFINRTHEIFTEYSSQYGLSNAHKNLGIIEYTVGNFDLAEKHLNESLNVKKEVGDLLSMPTIYEYFGLCYLGKGQKDKGFAYLKESLDMAIKNNQKKIQLNIYSKLADAYLSNHDLENAVSCQKKQIEIQELLQTNAASVKFEQLQSIFEIDKKNAQIVELEKQNEINSLKLKQQRISQMIMIAGILAALLFSVFFYLFYLKIRHKNLELKSSNAAKDKFFAIIAHDLRGPTGNLAHFLEYLNDTFNDHSPAELKSILTSVYKSAESVSVLLENLLVWAQSQLHRIEYNPVRLKLSDVLLSSTKGLKQLAEDKQIDIKFELNDGIHIMADINMVQTITRNLLSNAIKYSHRGTDVIIKSGIDETNNANIQIIDHGVGIDESVLPKIFDLSNSVHTKGTENEKSTGLGLILVKDFIEKNKGTFTIESKKNKGTIFSFTLPLA